MKNDSSVCILAGCRAYEVGGKEKKKSQTSKTNDRLYGTVRVGIHGFKRWRVAAELLSSTSSFKKKKKKVLASNISYMAESWMSPTYQSCIASRWALKTEQDKTCLQHFFVLLPPCKGLFTTSKQSRYGKEGRVSHREIQPPTSRGTIGTGPCPMFARLLSLTFHFFHFLVTFFFSLRRQKSTSGITASSSFFFSVLVSELPLSLPSLNFISPGLRSQRTVSAQLVDDLRSKCTGDCVHLTSTGYSSSVNNISTGPFTIFTSGKRHPFNWHDYASAIGTFR